MIKLYFLINLLGMLYHIESKRFSLFPSIPSEYDGEDWMITTLMIFFGWAVLGGDFIDFVFCKFPKLFTKELFKK